MNIPNEYLAKTEDVADQVCAQIKIQFIMCVNALQNRWVLKNWIRHL